MSVPVAEIEQALLALERAHRALDAAFDGLKASIGYDIDSPLSTAASGGLTLAEEQIAERFGLEKYAIFWWVWENDFGRKGMGCSIAGEPVKAMKTARQYARFLVWEMTKGGSK